MNPHLCESDLLHTNHYTLIAWEWRTYVWNRSGQIICTPWEVHHIHNTGHKSQNCWNAQPCQYKCATQATHWSIFTLSYRQLYNTDLHYIWLTFFTARRFSKWMVLNCSTFHKKLYDSLLYTYYNCIGLSKYFLENLDIFLTLWCITLWNKFWYKQFYKKSKVEKSHIINMAVRSDIATL